MGPLQYMVIGYDKGHFRDGVLPLLRKLKRRGIVSVLDAVILRRDGRGQLTREELVHALPDEDALITPTEGGEEWFSEEDVDAVAQRLAPGAAAVLLLLEHAWAVPLESLADEAAGFLGGDVLASDLEQALIDTTGRAAAAVSG